MKEENIKSLLIKTSKFKHVNMILRFVLPYDHKDYALSQMLGYVFGIYAQKYPTKEVMRAKKDYLYAASLSLDISLKRDVICLDMNYTFLNPKYTKDVTFKDYTNFLIECLFEPYFDDKIINEVKFNLLANISRQLDKPEVFAYDRVLSLAGEDNFLGFKKLDISKEIESLNTLDLESFYKKLLKEASIYLVLVGDLKGDEFDDLKDKLSDHSFNMYHMTRKIPDLKDFGLIEEDKDLSQSTLLMYYQFPLCEDFKKRVAMMLANGLLGSMPSSLLFDDVREKRGYCYSIYSSVNYYDSSLLIYSAISLKNKEAIISAIQEDLSNLIESDFVKEHLKMVKEYYTNQLLSSDDYASSILSFNLNNLFLNRRLSPQEYLKYINDCDESSIKEALKSLQLKMIYCLRGKESA